MPTYELKIGYQLPGDRYYQNFKDRKGFSDVVIIEISLNDILCDTDRCELQISTKPLRVCTLEDIIAEKLRALLQQIPRRRSRPQDVFDIASMVRRHGATLDLEKVSDFLVRKSAARQVVAIKSAFNDSVSERALVGYEEVVLRSTTKIIPFDEAWEEVLALVSRLSIPT